jgi:2-polyprenyl-3-methyl-5-hydroxy-6-metoxy-1,4-benzoquinol methylase
MKVFDPEARTVRARYAGQSPAARFYVAARLLSCPFGPIADCLPRTGTLLDIGCGSGVFCHLAARRGLAALGIDPDPQKIAWAQGSLGPDDAITFRVNTLDTLGNDEQCFEAVSLIDVLYLEEPAEQMRMLASARALLALGGHMIVKTSGATPVWKARLNRTQETLAVFGLRYTQGHTVRPPDETVLRDHLRRLGLQVTTHRLDRGYPHPHLLFVAQAP